MTAQTVFTFMQANGYQAGEYSYLVVPPQYMNSKAGAKCLLALHGINGIASQPSIFVGWLQQLKTLAANGFITMGIDYGAQGASATGFNNPWWGTPAMTACTNARTYLLTTLGASGSTKIGFLDYSLGGGTGFNWNSRNNTLVSGIISYAPACDGDYFYNLAGQPINQGYAASMDLAYAASTTTLTGSGTLNQVGSTLTLTGAMGLPVSGTLIIYQRTTYQNIAVGATGAIYVAYTAGGGTTTLLNCTIATGSQTWGTAGDGTWTGAATPGAWAANAATRSPVLIATNPAFDNVPLHLYTGTADATVPTSQVQTFATAVGPNAVVHSIAGGTHTSIVNNPAQISSAEILSIVSSFGW